ncbi:hypothetical protein SPI_03437 [Niveomyces insectorum RCEF 264]|uniref:Uncharacterized protein n=1 Tax=Niveomyces insectorum RCEF 264 TaxID=1081102 RepID=A0A167W302_9HYPO|nr:hypothetical protein SPI_03437 [Niveomyces insectorum RCEF 264]
MAAAVGVDSEDEDEVQRQTAEEREAALDGCTLACSLALLDHQLKGNEYDSVVVSALAAMMVRGDGGWEAAQSYHPHITEGRQHGLSERLAAEEAEGVFELVQPMIKRFMASASETTQPSPMDWHHRVAAGVAAVAASLGCGVRKLVRLGREHAYNRLYAR